MDGTEIFTMDSDGTNVRQLTLLNATSLTPKFLPNGNEDLIIFASNYGSQEQQLAPGPFSLFIANHKNGNTIVKKVGFICNFIKLINPPGLLVNPLAKLWRHFILG
jgi:hypothetical protein